MGRVALSSFVQDAATNEENLGSETESEFRRGELDAADDGTGSDDDGADGLNGKGGNCTEAVKKAAQHNEVVAKQNKEKSEKLEKKTKQFERKQEAASKTDG